ncbi:MAG: universal stress protein [Halobacteriaceae archaeon]
MFDTILVPTDGSGGARRAAEHAVELAAESGGTVHALSVVHMGDADFVATPSDIAETRDRLEEHARAYVDEVADLASAADVACVTTVRAGIPEDEILAYADDQAVDLIAMGKRGRSELEDLLLGSTTRRVVGRASVPVHAV